MDLWMNSLGRYMKIYVAMKEWRQWHTFVMHQVKKSNALGLHVSMQQTHEVIRVHRNVCQDNEIVSALSISVKKQACHLHEYFIWLNKFVNVPDFFILISVHWKESSWSSYIYIYTLSHNESFCFIFCNCSSAGTHPTNDISIEFKIRPKVTMPWLKMYSTDHNKILHMSWQCHCRDMCKISLWSVKQILN